MSSLFIFDHQGLEGVATSVFRSVLELCWSSANYHDGDGVKVNPVLFDERMDV